MNTAVGPVTGSGGVYRFLWGRVQHGQRPGGCAAGDSDRLQEQHARTPTIFIP